MFTYIQRRTNGRRRYVSLDAATNLSNGGNSTEMPQPMKQNLTLILLGLTAAAVLLIVGIVAVATVLACRKQPRVVLRQRRNSKPPDDLELSEAGFGEGFHRRSAQYRASLYTQEMELEANIRQTGSYVLLAVPCLVVLVVIVIN